MSDKHIEKSLLYLIFISVVLHVAAYVALTLFPPEKQKGPKEPTMIDLTELPPLPTEKQLKPKAEPPKPRQAPQPTPPTPPLRTLKRQPSPPLPILPRPVPRFLTPQRELPQARREAAPKAKNERMAPSRSAPNVLGKTEAPKAARTPGKTESPIRAPENGKEVSRGEGLLRPQRGNQRELAKLFPSAKRLANLEESYRKKFEDAEEGDTRLMDTSDPTIGTFTRRLRALLLSRLNTITPRNIWLDKGRAILLVTINREGSVEEIKVLESTGNKILDELAMTAVRTSGYAGPLPRSWPHEKLKLIYSFVNQQGGMGIYSTWE